MKCLNCQINESTIHPQLGVLPCSECTNRHKGLKRSSKPVEFTTEEIKEERKAYKSDILQPEEDAITRFGVEKIGTAELRGKLGMPDKQFLATWLIQRGQQWIAALLPRIESVKVNGKELEEI